MFCHLSVDVLCHLVWYNNAGSVSMNHSYAICFILTALHNRENDCSNFCRRKEPASNKKQILYTQIGSGNKSFINTNKENWYDT